MSNAPKIKTVDALYTLADLERMLKVPRKRLAQMVDSGELLGPDIIVPGGGHKGRRWSASRLNVIFGLWATVPLAA